jgi:hypothetical protein
VDDARNPYATPGASVSVDTHAPLFAVSTAKLTALSLATFGLYQLSWHYQSWQRIRARAAKPMRPFWRTVFAPLWSFELFTHLNHEATAAGVESSVSPGGHGAAYLLLNVMSRLSAPFWLISLASFLPLLPANGLACGLNERLAPDAPALVGWNAWNLVGLVVRGPAPRAGRRGDVPARGVSAATATPPRGPETGRCTGTTQNAWPLGASMTTWLRMRAFTRAPSFSSRVTSAPTSSVSMSRWIARSAAGTRWSSTIGPPSPPIRPRSEV